MSDTSSLLSNGAITRNQATTSMEEDDEDLPIALALATAKKVSLIVQSLGCELDDLLLYGMVLLNLLLFCSASGLCLNPARPHEKKKLRK